MNFFKSIINSQIIIFYCAILTVLLFKGCEYNTNEVYYRELDLDMDPPDLSIDLNLEEDTIYLYSNYAAISLEFKTEDIDVRLVRFTVNGEVHDIPEEKDNLYIYDLILPDEQNVTKVSLEIYTSTGTGSIGDKLEYENYLYTFKEWTLIYNPNKPKIFSEVIDGRLKVYWEPLKSSLFRGYRVSYDNFYDTVYNNWIIDSTYIGLKKNYRVTYLDNGLRGLSVDTNVNYSLPEVSLETTDSTIIKWSKGDFFNNLDGFKVIVNSDEYYLSKQDTQFTYTDGKFGVYINASVEYIPKSNESDEDYLYAGMVSYFYPLSYFPSTKKYFLPKTGNIFYYISDNDGLILNRFSLNSKANINSTSIGYYDKFGVTPNDKYLAYVEESTNDLYLLNSTNLGLNRKISNRSDFSFNSMLNLDMSDVGTGVFYKQDTIILFDILNNKVLAEEVVPGWPQFYEISANGKYVYIPRYNTLYEYSADSLNTIWTNGETVRSFTYSKFSPFNDTIVVYDNENIYIKRCADFSTITSYSLNQADVFDVDFVNRLVLAHSDNNAFLDIYNLDTGDKLYTVPSYLDSYLYIFANHIFHFNAQFNLQYIDHD